MEEVLHNSRDGCRAQGSFFNTCNPCILRTNTDNGKFGVLAAYKSAAMPSVKRSPEPVKLDPEVIATYPNVAVVRRA